MKVKGRAEHSLVRLARARDKAPLMSFIKDVWGGHDYIPRVWDAWIHDRRNKMFVVEVDGVTVGMNRIRFLEDGSAWFEGARVHPDYRGLGLATKLGENSMKLARERGASVFRLTSSVRNRVAHRQIARMGFREVSRVSVYQTKPRTPVGPQKGVKFASLDDVPRLFAMTRASRDYRIGHGVYWEDFYVTSLTPETLTSAVSEKRVLVEDGAVAMIKKGGEGRELWNQVCFIAGEPEAAVKLIRHAFRKRRARITRNLIYLPQGSKLIGALRKEGFERAWSLILFERNAANG